MWHRVPIFPINRIFIAHGNSQNAMRLLKVLLYLNYRENDSIGFWTLGTRWSWSRGANSTVCSGPRSYLFWTSSLSLPLTVCASGRVLGGGWQNGQEQSWFTSGGCGREHRLDFMGLASAVPRTSSDSSGQFLSLSAAFAFSSLNWPNRRSDTWGSGKNLNNTCKTLPIVFGTERAISTWWLLFLREVQSRAKVSLSLALFFPFQCTPLEAWWPLLRLDELSTWVGVPFIPLRKPSGIREGDGTQNRPFQAHLRSRHPIGLWGWSSPSRERPHDGLEPSAYLSGGSSV